MHLSRVGVFVISAGLSFVLNVVVFRQGFADFSLVTEGGLNDDGFNSQLVYAYLFFSRGVDSGIYEEVGPLLLIHILRLLVALPFWLADVLFGNIGQTFFIYALLIYIAIVVRPYLNPLYLLPLLVVPLFFSWRSLLVMISVPLYFAFVNSNSRDLFKLFLAFLFSSLSSAALVFLAGATYIYYRKGLLHLRMNFIILGVFPLFSMFAIVLLTKFNGFLEGANGYTDSATSNPLLSIVYRSTFAVKLTEGDLNRKILFGFMIVFVLAFTIYLLMRRSRRLIDQMYFLSLFGLFVEGMGAMIIAVNVLLVIGGMVVDRSTGLTGERMRTHKSRVCV